MGLSTSLITPSISISLSLSPHLHRVTAPTTVPTLSIQATLHASQPITICSWHTILYPTLALRQDAFEIIDKSTNTSIRQMSTRVRRYPIVRQFGTSDEKLFITLMPEVPYIVQTPFGCTSMDQLNAMANYKGVYGVSGLKKGEYTLRVLGEAGRTGRQANNHISWWQYGTKEDNLAPARANGPARTHGNANISRHMGASGKPSPLVLDVAAIPAVDFSVE